MDRETLLPPRPQSPHPKMGKVVQLEVLKLPVWSPLEVMVEANSGWAGTYFPVHLM